MTWSASISNETGNLLVEIGSLYRIQNTKQPYVGVTKEKYQIWSNTKVYNTDIFLLVEIEDLRSRKEFEQYKFIYSFGLFGNNMVYYIILTESDEIFQFKKIL